MAQGVVIEVRLPPPKSHNMQKRREYHDIFQIDEDGKLFMPDRLKFLRWLEEWPGMRLSATFEIQTPGSSKLIQTYYNRSIVPDFQNAYKTVLHEWLTKKEVDERLRSMAPMMKIELSEEETGGFNIEAAHTIYTADTSLVYEFIEFLKYVGATKFNVVIKDPKKL